VGTSYADISVALSALTSSAANVSQVNVGDTFQMQLTVDLPIIDAASADDLEIELFGKDAGGRKVLVGSYYSSIFLQVLCRLS